MIIIFLGLVTAMVMIIVLLPPEMSVMDAIFVAGKAGKLEGGGSEVRSEQPV